jgi:hypothetical protein
MIGAAPGGPGRPGAPARRPAADAPDLGAGTGGSSGCCGCMWPASSPSPWSGVWTSATPCWRSPRWRCSRWPPRTRPWAGGPVGGGRARPRLRGPAPHPPRGAGPTAVFNHPAAQQAPWKWALIHGRFVLAASVAYLVNSRSASVRRSRSAGCQPPGGAGPHRPLTGVPNRGPLHRPAGPLRRRGVRAPAAGVRAR